MVMGVAVKELASLLCLQCACAAQERILFSAFEGGASVLCSYTYLVEMEKNLPTWFSVCVDVAV